MMLLREVLGTTLRSVRQRQQRTLREISAISTVSLGYLSEIERGQKEASSELLSAICTALDITLADVLREAGNQLDHRALATVTPMPFARPGAFHSTCVDAHSHAA
ncbi:MAG: XRE family transcriptional regulator [Acidimicrobiales bacterium]|nr:MAG: XRE family transcriptional regulator [Acidimicrobiales bacterium]